MIQAIETIDAHVGGQPLRLITGGVPRVRGGTMASKRESMTLQADRLRRAIVLEPRGHIDMFAAMLTEPVSPGSHAGVLFMHGDGFAAMSGHGVIGVTTIALERGLIGGADETLVLDTEAGTVHARARMQVHGDRRRVDSVSFTNVPSFVASPGQSLRVESRDLRVDVAFGGLFYAIADTEAVGIPLDPSHEPELRRLGVEIQAALNQKPVEHPTDASRSGVAGVVFTGVPRDPEAHLRNVTVSSHGAVDRSPSGTGTSAVMAVLDAMGLLADGHTFVHESLGGTLHRGRVVRRTQVGEVPAIVPEIEGAAWITGEHRFLLDEDDPLQSGLDWGRS